MLRHRTLVISGKKTSIALERVFWEAVDSISEGDWKVCSGQLIPDSKLVRFSAFVGGTPLLN